MTHPGEKRAAEFGWCEARGGTREDGAAQWIEERTAVLRALEGFPEARAEVIRELEAVCRRPQT